MAAQAFSRAKELEAYGTRVEADAKTQRQSIADLQHNLGAMQKKVAGLAVENYQAKRKLQQVEQENEKLHARCLELHRERAGFEEQKSKHHEQIKKLFQRIDSLKATGCEATDEDLRQLEKRAEATQFVLALAQEGSARRDVYVHRLVDGHVRVGQRQRAVRALRAAWRRWAQPRGGAWRRVVEATFVAGQRQRNAVVLRAAWRTWAMLGRGTRNVAKVLEREMCRRWLQKAQRSVWQAWRARVCVKASDSALKVLEKTTLTQCMRHKKRTVWRAWHALIRPAPLNATQKVQGLPRAFAAWASFTSNSGLFVAKFTVFTTATRPRKLRARVFFAWLEAMGRGSGHDEGIADEVRRRAHLRRCFRVWVEDYAFVAQGVAQSSMVIFRQALLQVLVLSCVFFVLALYRIFNLFWHDKLIILDLVATEINYDERIHLAKHVQFCVKSRIGSYLCHQK